MDKTVFWDGNHSILQTTSEVVWCRLSPQVSQSCGTCKPCRKKKQTIRRCKTRSIENNTKQHDPNCSQWIKHWKYPPSNFRWDVVTPGLYVIKHKLGAIEWGCWAPFSPNIALTTKCPFVSTTLTYGEVFPCYKMPLRFQQLHPARTYPFIFKDCTCKGTSLLQNATLVSTISIKIHQASPFIIHHRSIQIMHHHASVVFQN